MPLIRVLRVIEYVGELEIVEDHLKRCTHGSKAWGHGGGRITMHSSIVGNTRDLVGEGSEESLRHELTILREEVYAANAILTGNDVDMAPELANRIFVMAERERQAISELEDQLHDAGLEPYKEDGHAEVE